jgi:hypothetical protein
VTSEEYYDAAEKLMPRDTIYDYAKDQLVDEIEKSRLAYSPMGEERLRTWSLVVLALRSY